MNNRFPFSLLEKISVQKKKQKEIEQKEGLEKCVRKQVEELTEELNFRLLCYQLEEEQQKTDIVLARILKTAGLNYVWEFLGNTPDVLWIEKISVVEMIFPEKENLARQLMNRVMSFITYKKS